MLILFRRQGFMKVYVTFTTNCVNRYFAFGIGEFCQVRESMNRELLSSYQIEKFLHANDHIQPRFIASSV